MTGRMGSRDNRKVPKIGAVGKGPTKTQTSTPQRVSVESDGVTFKRSAKRFKIPRVGGRTPD